MTAITYPRYVSLLAILLSCVACRDKSQDFAVQGASKAQRGDYKGGIADFDEALKLNPRNDDAYFFRGQARDKLNDFDGAIDDFTKYIELVPDRYDGYLRRGLAKAAKDDFSGAITDYTIAVRKVAAGPSSEERGNRPKSEVVADIDEARRLASAHLKDFAKATDSLSKVIELDPKNVDALYERGSARMRAGDIDGGCKDWLAAKIMNYPVAEKVLEQFGESTVQVGGGNGLPKPCQAGGSLARDADLTPPQRQPVSAESLLDSLASSILKRARSRDISGLLEITVKPDSDGKEITRNHERFGLPPRNADGQLGTVNQKGVGGVFDIVQRSV
jgi:tetratricopeptide (TPR) repeat protein